MPDLAADLARIAALRGKPLDNYVTAEKERSRAARSVHAQEILNLFRLPPNATSAEFRVYDRLPARSRLLLQNVPFNASAMKYADLLERCGDETWLIDTIRANMGWITKAWVMDHFGSSHPTARRL